MNTTIANFIHRAITALPDHPFSVQLPSGELFEPGGPAKFTLVLREPSALDQLLAAPSWRALGEAYLRDAIDIEGDIEAVYPLAELVLDTLAPEDAEPELQANPELGPFARGDEPHSRPRDAAAIAYHYDQSNAVFARITDRTFNYSAAYFHDLDDELEQAQRNKMDRVCRKAGLSDDVRVLDIGCGWGGLLSHLASHYQAQVTGITISKAQAEFVRERMVREQLDERVEVVVCDYREIDESQPYDKILSVGMVEHVGVERLRTYFDKAFRLLAPDGVFVVQGVSSSVSEASTKAIDFTNAYVFPDADMPYLSQYLDAAQAAGFEVRDVENLREHYAWTHRLWRANLERNAEAIIAEVGLPRYRSLRLLFSYATHYMLAGKASVYQFVLWKPRGHRPSSLPLRREL